MPALLAIMLLTSCTRNINGAADELRQYSWECVLENGNAASLLFCETKGYLRLKTHDGTLHIHGLCVADNEKLMICDENSGMNYTFGYILYGDKVELNLNGGVLTLNKLI